jgi:hypothetical protein
MNLFFFWWWTTLFFFNSFWYARQNIVARRQFGQRRVIQSFLDVFGRGKKKFVVRFLWSYWKHLCLCVCFSLHNPTYGKYFDSPLERIFGSYCPSDFCGRHDLISLIQ